VDVKHPVAGSISVKNISINNSTVRFYCAETSPVTLSMYALNGRLVKRMPDQTLTKGTHSIRWDALDNPGVRAAPGLYMVRLKIKESEYQTLLNVSGQR
jgi:flagellar hook assembly protein FlgD